MKQYDVIKVKFNSDDDISSLYKLINQVFINVNQANSSNDIINIINSGSRYFDDLLPSMDMLISDKGTKDEENIKNIFISLFKIKKYIEALDQEYKRLVEIHILNNINNNINYENHNFKLYKFGFRNDNEFIPISNKYDKEYNKFVRYIRSKEINYTNFDTHILTHSLKNVILNYPNKYRRMIRYDPPIPMVLVKDDIYIYKLTFNKSSNTSDNTLYYNLINKKIDLYKLFTNTIFSEFYYSPINLSDNYFNEKCSIDTIPFFNADYTPNYTNFKSLISELKFLNFDSDKIMKNTLYDFITDEQVI